VRYSGDERVISYGTSSYGYDVRCSNEFKVFTNVHSKTVDPKNFDSDSFVDMDGDYCIIPPNSFALARTVEYFKIPHYSSLALNHSGAMGGKSWIRKEPLFKMAKSPNSPLLNINILIGNAICNIAACRTLLRSIQANTEGTLERAMAAIRFAPIEDEDEWSVFTSPKT